MIRVALLLAIGSANGACSADRAPDNAVAAGNENIAAARSEAGAPARALDRGTGSAMAGTQIFIRSDRGGVMAELVDNDATRALLRMLPVTIEMRDHLRQEKTGNLPSPLPDVQRQTDFSAGTLGLWSNDDFVIYYGSGRVPAPGIGVLGRVVDDVAVFDRPGPVTVRLERVD
jgi:hypothetical protein